MFISATFSPELKQNNVGLFEIIKCLVSFYNANKNPNIPRLSYISIAAKIIIKETYRRKHLIGDLFAFSEGYSMTIKDGA